LSSARAPRGSIRRNRHSPVIEPTPRSEDTHVATSGPASAWSNFPHELTSPRMRWRKAHPELESTGALAAAAADVATMPGHAQRPVEGASTERVSIESRAVVDGLRALSVIAVVLFHAGVPAFSGGYVVVDVFFVISGYLITALLSA